MNHQLCRIYPPMTKLPDLTVLYMYFCTFLNSAPSWFLQRFLYLPYTRFMAPLRFQVYAPFLTRYFELLWYRISGPILYCRFMQLTDTNICMFLQFPNTKFLHPLWYQISSFSWYQISAPSWCQISVPPWYQISAPYYYPISAPLWYQISVPH